LARTDDFINAFKLAAAELKDRDPAEVSRLSSVDFDPEEQEYRFDFIGRPHAACLPDFKIRLIDSEQDVPVQEQGLILHYLNAADGTPPTGELITYREVPSGEFYYAAFVKRAEAPLLSVFGQSARGLVEAAGYFGGEPVADMGDAAVKIQALPQVALTLVIWEGDDEFEPSGKILFDKNVSHYLSTEDIAVVSGMVVYRLMRQAR